MMYLRAPVWTVVTCAALAWGCQSNQSSDTDNAGGEAGSGDGGATQMGGNADGGRGGTGGKAGGGGVAPQQGGSPGDAGVKMDANVSPPLAACDPPKLKLTRITTVDTPMALSQPQGDDRLYIVERAGRIRIFQNNKLVDAPFFDNRASVVPPAGDNERGLLGLAFHPQYKDNGRFFIFYTRRGNDMYSQGNAGDIVIAEGKRSAADPNKAEAATKALKVVRHDYDDFHNGGFLTFGPDGMLYAGTGDAGRDGYGSWDGPSKTMKSGVCQDPKEPLCKILRIDVDKPTVRPAGNFPDGDIHVWALGVRNPFRGSFDRVTGDLYFGDVGEASWEEINYAAAGTTGHNWGWAFLEGDRCFPWFIPIACERTADKPLVSYFHDGTGVMTDPASYMMMGKACSGGTNADCSRAVIGGFVYRGQKIQTLNGRYIYADHAKNQVMSLVVDKGKSTCERDLTSDLKSNATPLQGITGFGEDAMGELYVLDLFGNVYRFDPE
ncbi:MAG: PQQ-dependent sugar dehydrogenase [Deltaproteobacteria bacterium]|nr:PQQ-dependent sugar dehydrogenase [Deltaproteobacteria bacterium]